MPKTALPKLTTFEQVYFDLLESNPDGVDRELLRGLHEFGWNSNLIDVHMKNLRKKLVGLYEIEAVRNFGYKMRPV